MMYLNFRDTPVPQGFSLYLYQEPPLAGTLAWTEWQGVAPGVRLYERLFERSNYPQQISGRQTTESTLFPRQAVEAPPPDGATVMLLVEISLEAFGDIEHITKTFFYQ